MDQKILTLIHFHKIYTYPKNQVSVFFSFFIFVVKFYKEILKNGEKMAITLKVLNLSIKLKIHPGVFMRYLLCPNFNVLAQTVRPLSPEQTNKHPSELR